MTPAFSERPKWPFFGLLNIFRPLCSLKGVFLCKKVSFATVLPTRYEHLNLSVKFLFWPSFGLQFYTSLSLASLGAAWCKISGLIPAKKKILHFEKKCSYLFVHTVAKNTIAIHAACKASIWSSTYILRILIVKA